MKKNKKVIFSIISIILVMSIIVGIIVSFSKYMAKKEIYESAINIGDVETNIYPKNIILMIGDGMGPNHIEATKKYLDLEILNMENLALYDGEVTTFSRNDLITDSAAAATAMSTGIKVDNDAVSKVNNQNIENMCEYAKRFGKKTGIITTSEIYDATPASFSAHANNRYESEIIIDSQLNSGVDLFISGRNNEQLLLKENIELSGYSYTNLLHEMNYFFSNYDSKVYSVFDGINYSTSNETDEQPSLSTVSLASLNYLEKISNAEGFFLMIEGADIDTYSHLNKFDSMVNELYGFDETVKTVVNWAKQNKDTIVIVTADHECGNLTYSNESKEFLNDQLFKSENHTGQNVRVFFYGQFPFTEEYWNSINNELDNTQISDIIRQSIYNYKNRENY